MSKNDTYICIYTVFTHQDLFGPNLHWVPMSIGRKDPRGEVKTNHRFTGQLGWKTSKNDFTDDDCTNLKIIEKGVSMKGFNKGSLQNCKQFCLETKSCNAINYDKGSTACVVRRCTDPIVPPVKDNYPAFESYWLLGPGG